MIDLDTFRRCWDHAGARYLLTDHAKARLVEMAGPGAIELIGHVLERGRWVEPDNSSRYPGTCWVVLGDLTLAVENRGRRRNIITALYSNDDAWTRNANPATGRKHRPGWMKRKGLESYIHNR